MNNELKARVEKWNSFGYEQPDKFPVADRLVNDLSTALQEAAVINEAGFMQPERCTQDCLNYHGALADADHFEEAFKLSQQQLQIAMQALSVVDDLDNIAYNALCKIKEMENESENQD